MPRTAHAQTQPQRRATTTTTTPRVRTSRAQSAAVDQWLLDQFARPAALPPRRAVVARTRTR